MNRLAALLPEYELVIGMDGVGKITGTLLMAEIGDVRRFSHKGALVAYAGVDAPPYQCLSYDAKNRHVSKRGSPHLRKVLFEIASMIRIHGNVDNPVFCFMSKKQAEGKPFYVYTVAGVAKSLRIYYAKVKEHLSGSEPCRLIRLTETNMARSGVFAPVSATAPQCREYPACNCVSHCGSVWYAHFSLLQFRVFPQLGT